jgi:hypothetical protein
LDPGYTAGFLFAGRAVFTLVGKSRRYTYQVDRMPARAGQRSPPYAVFLGTGDHGMYLGLINPGQYRLALTAKSRMTAEAQPVRALNWALPYLMQGKPLPSPAEIYHEGRCGRCGRALTDPESIKRGLGPLCAEILGGGA